MSKWYNKSIEIVTKKNFISVLLFVVSITFYLLKKVSDNENARHISIYSFSLGIGEYIGDKIADRYSEKRYRKRLEPLFTLLLLMFLIISLSIEKFFESANFFSTFLVGGYFGVKFGFGIKKMKGKNK